MNLDQLESIVLGETTSRRDMLEQMRLIIKENYDIDTEPVSYHDIECMWLRSRIGTDKFAHISVECMLEFGDIAEYIRRTQKELNNGS